MKNYVISHDATLKDAVLAIEKGRKTLALVLDAQQKLLGTLSDGDIRRALLAGYDLGQNVQKTMQSKPVTASEKTSHSDLVKLFKTHALEAIPLVDGDGCLKDLVLYSDLMPGAVTGSAEGFAAAVIMAGGEGTRLRPLTETIPKPMVEIDGMPLLERQIRHLVKAGINKIYLSVNYLSEIIEQHFAHGEKFAISIEYLYEDKKLGTAGALSLLPDDISGPLLVMNGDVLTNANYQHLLTFFHEQQSDITVAAIEHHIQIPYGVIQADGTKISALQEKPSQNFLCNAGIYVISPEILQLIPHDKEYHLTDLINQCLVQQKNVTVFPMHEYWTDIGTPEDLARAREEILQLENLHV